MAFSRSAMAAGMTTPSGVEREGAGEKVRGQRKTPQEFKLPLAKTCGWRAVRFVFHIVAIMLQENGEKQGPFANAKIGNGFQPTPFAQKPALIQGRDRSTTRHVPKRLASGQPFRNVRQQKLIWARILQGPGGSRTCRGQRAIFREWNSQRPGGRQRCGAVKERGQQILGIVPCARSTAIERCRRGQAESQEAKQFDGGENPVGAPVEIAQTIESLDGQGQTGNQPDQQQALGMVMTDVFQSVAILGVIEPLILDLPAALRQAEQGTMVLRRWVGKSVNQKPQRGFHWVCIGDSE